MFSFPLVGRFKVTVFLNIARLTKTSLRTTHIFAAVESVSIDTHFHDDERETLARNFATTFLDTELVTRRYLGTNMHSLDNERGSSARNSAMAFLEAAYVLLLSSCTIAWASVSAEFLAWLCFIGFAMFVVRTGLLSAESLAPLVSVRLSTCFWALSPVCIMEVPRDVVRSFGGILLLEVSIQADTVLRSLGGINMSDDTINDILTRPLLVFWI